MYKTEEKVNDRVGAYGYLRINNFLNMLKHSKILTYQQKRILWGQATHGDLDGAMRGYQQLASVREDYD